MSYFKNIFKSKNTIQQERRDMFLLNRTELFAENKKALNKKLSIHPLISIKNTLQRNIKTLKLRRKSIDEQWKAKYEKFSLWDKLNNSEDIDLSKIDGAIDELVVVDVKFKVTYSDDIKALSSHYQKAILRSEKRIDATFNKLIELIEQHPKKLSYTNDLFKKGLMFSAMSIPISVWDDLATSSDIYDSLRRVNGNFEGMSDAGIWWESLWMSEESLIGLMSLTKGAYFETLVAEDFGGELFEHFNNPGTDIQIDGVLYQIKATDSVAYISSVDEDVPIIATTEVAIKTGVIDGGYENADLTSQVKLALDGSAVDIGDTAFDAVLAGAGGLGLFATIHGINHAQKKFDEGMDVLDAIEEGIMVAVEGTAKGLVDFLEMIWKIIVSRPIRFIGRLLLKIVNKVLDILGI